MPIALWCVLIAALMPYPLARIARGTTVSNNNPRDQYAAQSERQRRAFAAHQNCFEVFPFFAVAVIVALGASGNSNLLSGLAIAFVAVRAVYAWLYVTDRASLRSMAFLAGLIVTIVIFTLPLWYVPLLPY